MQLSKVMMLANQHAPHSFTAHLLLLQQLHELFVLLCIMGLAAPLQQVLSASLGQCTAVVLLCWRL